MDLPLQLDIVGVEPVEAMRLKARQVLGSSIPIIEATAEQLPFADGSLDAIFVAQAFHWFANEDVLRELHRTLAAGGCLVLVWNMEDAQCPWVADLRSLYEHYDHGIPQFRLGTWRDVWVTPTAKERFQSLQEKVVRNDLPSFSRDLVWTRILSKSYIANLDTSEQQQVKQQVELILNKHNLPSTFTYPHETFIAWTFKL